MRPVRGFDRPPLQWMFIVASVLLVAVTLFLAAGLRRERARREALHATELEGRLDRQQLQMRFAREQSAREALSIEVARLRGRAGAGADGGAPPTLTLTPTLTPQVTPPEPSVERPGRDQMIALRLVLPAGADPAPRFAISLRRWSGGPVLWTRGNLPATRVDGTPMVIATIVGDVLETGAYELTLTTDPGAHVAAYHVAVGGQAP